MENFDLPNNDAVDFTLETYEQPDNDAVDFAPREEEEGREPFDIGVTAPDIPLSLDLPMQPLSIRTMETGLALFLMGLLSVIGGAAWVLRNYAAGVMWSLGIVALLLSGLLGIGLELFWAILLATLLLLAMGWIVRWIQ